MDQTAWDSTNIEYSQHYVRTKNSVGPVQAGFMNGNIVLFVAQNPGNAENWSSAIDSLADEKKYFEMFRNSNYEMSKFLKSVYPEAHWNDISWINVYKTAFANHKIDVKDNSFYYEYLRKQINIIRPKHIISIGAVAKTALDALHIKYDLHFDHWSYLNREGIYDTSIAKYKEQVQNLVFNYYVTHCTNMSDYEIRVRYNFWNRQTKIVNFKQYFYVPDIAGQYTTYDGKRVKRIYRGMGIDPRGYPETYEADVYGNVRYLLDNKCRFTKQQKIGYFDIETNRGLDIFKVDKEIVSISLITNDNNKYCWGWRKDLKESEHVDNDTKIMLFSTEKSMVAAFLSFLRIEAFDVLVGWNSDKFDWPYLFNRCQMALGLNISSCSPYNKTSFKPGKTKDDFRFRIYGTDIIDLLKVYRKITYDKRPERYSLDFIAKFVLGRGKKDPGDIAKTWLEDIPKLMDYNLWDCLLVKDIDEKSRLLDFMMTLQEISSCPLDLCLWNKNVVDSYMLKEYNNQKVFPSIKNNPRADIEGAITGKIIFDKDGNFHSENPDAGLFKNVAVLDFSGMYPAIYRTFNISPDTFDDNGDVNINGTRFSSAKEGLIPAVFEELLKKRKYFEKLRDSFPRDSKEWYIYQNYQGGVKQIANSFFGITGYPKFRLYDPRITSAITWIGQQQIADTVRKAMSLGYNVRYSDTDSCFVEFGDCSVDEAIQKSRELEELINSSFEDFVLKYKKDTKHFFKIECEKIFSTIVFTGVKKKYVGKLCYKKGAKVDELFYRGIELVKRDTPKIFKEYLKTVVTKILNYETDIIKYTKEFKIRAQKDYNIRDIVVYKSISKNFEDYVKTMPQHIKAAKYSNKHLGTKFSRGDSVGMIFVKGKEVEAIGIDDEMESIPSEYRINWDKYFDLFVDGKLEMFSFLPSCRTQTSIFDFIENA